MRENRVRKFFGDGSQKESAILDCTARMLGPKYYFGALRRRAGESAYEGPVEKAAQGRGGGGSGRASLWHESWIAAGRRGNLGMGRMVGEPPVRIRLILGSEEGRMFMWLHHFCTPPFRRFALTFYSFS